MKRIIAIVLALTMLVSLTSCAPLVLKVPNQANQSTNDQYTDNNNTEQPTINMDGFITDDTQSDTNVDVNAPLSDNPSEWSKTQIVEAYKEAAIKTNPNVRSYQAMSLRSMVVNDGDGALARFIAMAKPIMEDVLASNSKEFDGLTGGFTKLVPSDVSGAKAYKSGNYTVIEMIMKEQTDHANGVMTNGTVGHAISVVGPVTFVTDQFEAAGMIVTSNTNKGQPLGDDNVSMTYKNPILKVAIDSNGMIAKGTWSYYVDLKLTNIHVNGMGVINVDVAKADAIIDFKVTLNGGF